MSPVRMLPRPRLFCKGALHHTLFIFTVVPAQLFRSPKWNSRRHDSSIKNKCFYFGEDYILRWHYGCAPAWLLVQIPLHLHGCGVCMSACFLPRSVPLGEFQSTAYLCVFVCDGSLPGTSSRLPVVICWISGWRINGFFTVSATS